MKRGVTVSAGVANAAPVALALFVSQPTAYPGYPAFVRCAELVEVANAPIVVLEPVLYTGQPEGQMRKLCARILFSPLVGEKRSFLTGLRIVPTNEIGLSLFVGDCKRNYQSANEAGKTLIVIQGGPEPYRPGYLLLFVLKRLYARKRPNYNEKCAQQFFRAYVRPKLSKLLEALPGGLNEVGQQPEPVK